MKKILLLAIVLIGFVLRVYKLDVRPLGLTWDEAALGYNAFSLLKTGRDEHAQVLPIVFKSFGDYKPGLYIYSAVPVIKLLGLNEFATRLPSAILGTLLITVVYLLTRNLFAPFLLAINPWAIHFSRGAWEANLNLLLTTLAVVLFIKKKYLTSALFLCLTFWAYQGAKMFTPMLLISLLVIYRPAIKKIIFPGLLLLLLLLPIIVGIGSQSGRLKVFSVFSYVRSAGQINKILRQDENNRLIYQLFHSEFLDQTRGIIERYLNHFSPRFLFIDGDWSNPRHSTPFYGYLHYPEILTLLIGLYYLLRSKNPASKILLVWLLLAPIPAALSRDIISGVRSLPMIVPLVIISGMGLSKIFKFKLIRYPFFLLLLLFTVYFSDLYFVHSPFYFSQYWLTPYKRVIELVNNNVDSFKRVVFTNTLGQPYIFILFYNRLDPGFFWTRSQRADNPVGDVGEVTNLDKYTFMRVDWPAQRGDTSTIFVGDQYELPQQDMNPPNLVRLGEIEYPNGLPALRIVGLK
ncbi:MAG: hypothetical protein G01um101416_106 [Microgenomates group bacterium Gr01-1014_16]|nr:MAG: hypothetical protein G01um101416_106 [Microgenomates group bacterium Gr01-1014_16]